jgi:hypothetical protein
MASKIVGLVRKSFRHLLLLFTKPHEFLANLEQFTNPGAFQGRLLNMVQVAPLQAEIVQGARPTLNVLLPEITQGSTTGGPNTVLNIGYRIAAAGIPGNSPVSRPGRPRLNCGRGAGNHCTLAPTTCSWRAIGPRRTRLRHCCPRRGGGYFTI